MAKRNKTAQDASLGRGVCLSDKKRNLSVKCTHLKREQEDFSYVLTSALNTETELVEYEAKPALSTFVIGNITCRLALENAACISWQLSQGATS